MSKTSPSQLNTTVARISQEARALLLVLAIKNNTSVAEELDKKLGIERKVSDMRLFPDEADLPKPSQLRGLVKGMTDGKLAEDYLRELRDDDRDN